MIISLLNIPFAKLSRFDSTIQAYVITEVRFDRYGCWLGSLSRLGKQGDAISFEEVFPLRPALRRQAQNGFLLLGSEQHEEK